MEKSQAESSSTCNLADIIICSELCVILAQVSQLGVDEQSWVMRLANESSCVSHLVPVFPIIIGVMA
jgi:hypothetical protein